MPDRARRFILRDTTVEAHSALDRTIGPFDDLMSYGRYLSGMGAFRAPVEKILVHFPMQAAGIDWDVPVIADLIAADMHDLDVRPHAVVAPPDLGHRLEDLLGALYVLEGSALGARLLYRRAQALGLTAQHGARHLERQSRPDGRWQRFVDMLDAPEWLDMDRVALAATRTFKVAEKAFESTVYEQQ